VRELDGRIDISKFVFSIILFFYTFATSPYALSQPAACPPVCTEIAMRKGSNNNNILSAQRYMKKYHGKMITI